MNRNVAQTAFCGETFTMKTRKVMEMKFESANGTCRPIVVEGKDLRRENPTAEQDEMLEDMATHAINELIIEKLSRPASVNSNQKLSNASDGSPNTSLNKPPIQPRTTKRIRTTSGRTISNPNSSNSSNPADGSWSPVIPSLQSQRDKLKIAPLPGPRKISDTSINSRKSSQPGPRSNKFEKSGPGPESKHPGCRTTLVQTPPPPTVVSAERVCISPKPPKVDNNVREGRKIKNLCTMRGKLSRSVDRLPTRRNRNDPKRRLSQVSLRDVALSPSPPPLSPHPPSPIYSSKCETFFPIELAAATSKSTENMSTIKASNSKPKFVTLKKIMINSKKILR